MALASALMLGLLGGCAHYVAKVERAPSAGQVAARVTSIDGKPARTARAIVAIERVPDGTQLLGAFVRAPSDPPCGSGFEATKWGRAGQPSPDESLRSGDELALELSGSALEMIATSASRLDLLVRLGSGDVRCIAVPIEDSSDGLTFETVERFTSGLDVQFVGYTRALGSVTSDVFFSLMLGAWLDRIHLSAGAGIGGAECKETRCPRENEEAEGNESASYQLVAGADTVLWEHGEFGVGAGLQYRVVHLTADTYEGEDAEAFWAHGPVIAPSLLAVWPVVKPHEIGGSRAAMIAFEIPVGVLFAGDRGHALTIGMNLRFRFTVL